MRTPLAACVTAAILLAVSPATTTGQEAQTNLPAMPSGEVQVMLIRNCLTALNHAVLTENYTILRGLGSQSFRERHSQERLAKTFRGLRDMRLDLSPVLVRAPRLTERPVINRNAQLRLAGVCPTTPLAVQFRIIYQHDHTGWTIDEISLELSEESATRQVSHRQPTARSQVQSATYQRPTQSRQSTTGQTRQTTARPSDSLFEQLRPATRSAQTGRPRSQTAQPTARPQYLR